jgi:excisionase family DNA binding protein
MTVQDHIEAKTYSAPEAARRIGCSRATLWRLMDAGELGWTQVRNRRRFTEAQIDDYLAKATRQPAIRQPVVTNRLPVALDPPDGPTLAEKASASPAPAPTTERRGARTSSSTSDTPRRRKTGAK